MANLRIKGDVSGYVDLVSPDVAGSQTVNLDKLVETDSSGNITATAFIGDGSQLTGVSSYTNSDLVTYLSNSSIGIGDSSPDAKLHVQTTSGSTTEPNVVAIFQADTDTTITTGGGTAIKFRGKSSGGNIANYDQAMISSYGQSTNNAHGLGFYYKPNASIPLTRGMLMDTNGSVCIGYGNPSSNTKLQVEGNINASGYISGGAGSVVQEVVMETNVLSTFSSVNAWGEPNSSYRLNITPKFSDSLIVLHYFVPLNQTTSGANNMFVFRSVRYSPNSSHLITSAGQQAGSSRMRVAGGGARAQNGYDQNDQNLESWIAYDRPGSTSQCTYGFEMKQENSDSGTIYIGYSSSDNGTWGYASRVIITAREIRQ